MMLVGMLALVVSACAQRTWNDKIDNPGAGQGYDARNRLPENSDERVIDGAVRARLYGMPTTFRLGPDQVDELITESGKLLRQSSEYKNFLEQINQAEEVEANTQTDSKADL